MSRVRLLACSLLVLCFPPGGAFSQTPSENPAQATGFPVVPEVLGPSDSAQGPPDWVSAERALGSEGIRSEYFTPQAQRRMGEILAVLRDDSRVNPWLRAAPEGCTVAERVGERISIDPIETDNLESLSRNAEAIYLGRVADQKEGFFGGRATSLYTLRDVEPLKALEGVDTPKTFFLTYPYARISVEEKTWCRVSERFPAHPSQGSQVLIFIYPHRFQLRGNQLILTPEEAEIFFETSGGEVSAPSAFDDPLLDESEPLTLEELGARTKHLLANSRDS